MIKQTIGELLEKNCREKKMVFDIQGVNWYLNLYHLMPQTGGRIFLALPGKAYVALLLSDQRQAY